MIKTYSMVLFWFAISVVSAGDPSIPGHHPLTQVQAGRLLMAELRCAACHKDIGPLPLAESIAPNIVDVGNRVSAEYLRRFLASPGTAHPGTSMPDVLASTPEADRPMIAEALTHYLVSMAQPSEPAAASAGPGDRQLGKELFHSIGCVACHGPLETSAESARESEFLDDELEETDDPLLVQRRAIKASAIPLTHVAQKYTIQSLSEFLFQPLQARPSGRMPDMKLTPDESLAIASYLVGDEALSSRALVPEATLVESGKKYFKALNCAACHAIQGIEAAPQVSSLRTSDLTGGCLSGKQQSSNGTRDSSPKFELDIHQVSAISAAIREEKVVDTDEGQLAFTLTAFGCIHCHVRNDYGGVHDDHSVYFKGNQLNLGDDGRIPPPLTWMGAKLKPTWLKKVLFDGESVRSYMSTRMPQYGADNLHHLPEVFRRVDTLTSPEMRIPTPENLNEGEQQREKVMRAAGRELVGDKGANCVACHTFNGKAASVNQGIELLTSFERLQPEWFYRYLQNPGAFRPRTVMPSAWPDGIAAFTTILDGDTHRQIEAIWYYLSLGTSAADPSGVRSESTKIAVADKAVTHRGRSRVAGFRGIAVGLPEELHYAFNAETGTLSAIWEGEFIQVNWSGQGSGEFTPVRSPIQLAQDVSFAMLENDDAPWPLLPVMTKEVPVNPDPLYPKNVGYQFRGYQLDDTMTPTFLYKCGEVEIADRTDVAISNGQKRLRRVLQFHSPQDSVVYFRALVGDIEREAPQSYTMGRLRLLIPEVATKLRSMPGDSGQEELLLRIQVPAGQSKMEVHYELRRE